MPLPLASCGPGLVGAAAPRSSSCPCVCSLVAGGVGRSFGCFALAAPSSVFRAWACVVGRPRTAAGSSRLGSVCPDLRCQTPDLSGVRCLVTGPWNFRPTAAVRVAVACSLCGSPVVAACSSVFHSWAGLVLLFVSGGSLPPACHAIRDEIVTRLPPQPQLWHLASTHCPRDAVAESAAGDPQGQSSKSDQIPEERGNGASAFNQGIRFAYFM